MVQVSICVPVYNRLAELKSTLEPLLRNVQAEGRGNFEVIVSVNPAEDGRETVSEYVKELHERYDFKFDILDKFQPASINFKNAVELSSGRLIWVVGDDDLILPGTLGKIADLLDKYDDLTWIFMCTARMRDITKLREDPINPITNHIKGGYYPNGKECVTNLHKQIDGGLLFSTSNLYLRSVFLQLAEGDEKNEVYQMASTFISAAKGSAYLIEEPCIIAGSNISWDTNVMYIRKYNDDLLVAAGEYYTKEEMADLVAYRMRHAALSTWFTVYKAILKGDKRGKEAFRDYYRMMPGETVAVTTFYPLIAVYLVIRHNYRKLKVFFRRIFYKYSRYAKKEIVKYM